MPCEPEKVQAYQNSLLLGYLFSLPDTFILILAKVVIHVWLQQPSGFPPMRE